MNKLRPNDVKTILDRLSTVDRMAIFATEQYPALKATADLQMDNTARIRSILLGAALVEIEVELPAETAP